MIGNGWCDGNGARNDSTKGSFEFKCSLSKIALAYSSKVLHLSYEHGPSNS